MAPVTAGNPAACEQEHRSGTRNSGATPLKIVWRVSGTCAQALACLNWPPADRLRGVLSGFTLAVKAPRNQDSVKCGSEIPQTPSRKREIREAPKMP